MVESCPDFGPEVEHLNGRFVLDGEWDGWPLYKKPGTDHALYWSSGAGMWWFALTYSKTPDEKKVVGFGCAKTPGEPWRVPVAGAPQAWLIWNSAGATGKWETGQMIVRALTVAEQEESRAAQPAQAQAQTVSSTSSR
jgi:hypothetical protein